MKYSIYKITDKRSGDNYIGLTNNYKKRMVEHARARILHGNDKGLEKHPCSKYIVRDKYINGQRVPADYKTEVLDIIDTDDKYDALDAEQYYQMVTPKCINVVKPVIRPEDRVEGDTILQLSLYDLRTCECGCKIQMRNLPRHRKGAKHLALVQGSQGLKLVLPV